MGWTWQYVLSQILTVVEYGLLGLSYLAKKRKTVVILDIVSMSLGILVYMLLGADTGIWMSVVVLMANFYYLYQEHKYGEMKTFHKRDYVFLTVVLLAILGLTIWTFEKWTDIFSVIATALYEISIWQKSTKTYKLLGIPVAASWMTYNGFEESIFGVICESVMLIASIVGFVREIIASHKKKRVGKKAI